MQWRKPVSEGGCRLQGYVIEIAPKSDPNSFVRVAETKLTSHKITGLKHMSEYIVRVVSFNEKGQSEPREKQVVARELTSEPIFDLSNISGNCFTVMESISAKLKIPVRAKPLPTISWQYEDIREGWMDVKEDARIDIEKTPISTILVIRDVRKIDGARYRITAKNEVGKKSAVVRLNVQGKPSSRNSVEFAVNNQ